jgi:hypothetical protein
MSADDDRLGREHAAFLSAVLGRRAHEDEQEEARVAPPEELALYLGRSPERELTTEDVRSWRSADHEHPEDEREPSAEATRENLAAFAAALRRPGKG